MDRKPFSILAVAGSLRQGSYNRGLLRAAEELAPCNGYLAHPFTKLPAPPSLTAIQLDMTGLTNDVARVRQILSAQTGPTILVAHSFGGAVITGLGKDAPNVVDLVYVSAFAPDQGETMNALITGGPQPAVGTAIRPDAYGLLWLDRDGFVQYFAPDVDHSQARVLSAVQKPIAASEFFGEHSIYKLSRSRLRPFSRQLTPWFGSHMLVFAEPTCGRIEVKDITM